VKVLLPGELPADHHWRGRVERSRPYAVPRTNLLTFSPSRSFPAVYRFSGDPVSSFYYRDLFPYITPVVYAMGLIAQTGSVYSTLCVTVERYIVICWPLR